MGKIEKIEILRAITDHIVNLTRKEKGLPSIQALEGDCEKKVKGKEPELLLNETINDTKKEEKAEFLKLAHEKAEKLCEITAKFDAGADYNSMQDMWWEVQRALKILKFFFIDLKEKSLQSIEAFSRKLEAAINNFKEKIGLQKREFFKNPDCLKGIEGIAEIIDSSNFVEGAEQSKDNKMIATIQYMNAIALKHYTRDLTEPKDLVKDIVTTAEIESRLHACIGRLAA